MDPDAAGQTGAGGRAAQGAVRDGFRTSAGRPSLVLVSSGAFFTGTFGMNSR